MIVPFAHRETQKACPACGKLLIGSIAILALASEIYGFFRTDFSLGQYWPGHSLHKNLLLAAVYLTASLVTWIHPTLRKSHRLITAAAFLVLVACGAGLGATAATLLLFLSALALGDLIIGPSAGTDQRPTWADALVATLAGLGLWSVAGWGLAHFRVNFPPLYVVLLPVPLVANRKAVARYAHVFRKWLLDEEQAGIGPGTFAIATVAVGFVMLQLAVGMWPEGGFDALLMHLRIASFVEHHRYFDFNVRENFLAVTPYFSNWLFTIAYLLGGEPASKLTNAVFLVLACGGTWGLVRQQAGAAWAILAVVILAATPLFLGTTCTLMSENYFTLSTVALAAALILAPRTASLRDSIRYDTATAILMTIPLLIKPYGALLTIPAFLIWAVHVVQWGGLRRLLPRGLWVSLWVIGMGSLPYVHAWILTGNPVFPFFNGVFRSPLFPTFNFVDGRWIGHLTWDILYRMTFDSPRYGECPGPGALGLHYLILIPCALASAAVVRNRLVWIGLILGICYGGGMLLLMQYMRYLLPVFPLFVAVSLVGLARGLDGHPRLRPLALLALLALCGINFCLLPSGYPTLVGVPLRVAFSSGGERYITGYPPTRKVISSINAAYGDSARVAFLGPPYATGLHGTALCAAVTMSNSRLTSNKCRRGSRLWRGFPSGS